MISSDVIRGEKETSDPLNPDDVLFIQRTERSKRESQSERAGSERVASLMSSAVCSIPLISPTGMPLLLHVTDQLPLHSSRLNLRARGCVPAWISAKARQASRGHASIELMFQRSEGNVVETYGKSRRFHSSGWVLLVSPRTELVAFRREKVALISLRACWCNSMKLQMMWCHWQRQASTAVA